MQEITNEVLTKAAEGDIEAFEVIYKAHAGFVYNVAYRVLYNKQDTEELVQEVFLNIYRNLKNFRFQSSFKTWVYRITANCAINYSKKMSREREKQKKYYQNINPWQIAVEPATENESHEEIIGLLLKTLGTDQRMCLVLRDIEGLSYREIAKTLKIGINTVRSRLKRAREKLLNMKKEVLKNEL